MNDNMTLQSLRIPDSAFREQQIFKVPDEKDWDDELYCDEHGVV